MYNSSKEDGADMRNYNLGTLCEFTINNFWKKIDKESMSARVLKEKYLEFYVSHIQEINESVMKLVKKHSPSTIDDDDE